MDIDYDNLIIFKDFEISVNNNFFSCRYDKKDFYIIFVTCDSIELKGKYNDIIKEGQIYICENLPDIDDSIGRYYIMRFATLREFLNKSPIKINIENNDIYPVNKIFDDLYENYYKGRKKEKNLYYAIKILELFDIIKKEYNDAESKNIHLSFTAKNIKKYINENLNASKTDLEKVFEKNKDHIERVFKQKYGITIQDYKNKIKCEFAKKLLENEEWSPKKVAQESGFNNVNNFRNIFKKITGQTPYEYRKDLKNRK